MKYFIDTEFIEGFHKPLFGKKRHFIDLISIGIIAEDGREYYAISNEFNPKDASPWVKENVISKLSPKKVWSNKNGGMDLPNRLYKSNDTIARDIVHFVAGEPQNPNGPHSNPEFYAYYADYDWVLLCSLFGTMMDLPKGFPMYCRDLKQMLDEKVMIHAIGVNQALKNGVNPIPEEHIKPINTQFEELLSMYKEDKEYPRQKNEHDALSDAKWNYELYKFIQKI